MRIKHAWNLPLKMYIALPRDDTKDILKYLIIAEVILWMPSLILFFKLLISFKPGIIIPQKLVYSCHTVWKAPLLLKPVYLKKERFLAGMNEGIREVDVHVWIFWWPRYRIMVYFTVSPWKGNFCSTWRFINKTWQTTVSKHQLI